MNEDLKERLRAQPRKVYEASARYRADKTELETFDAASRVAVKADGVKRTEADTDALVLMAKGRGDILKKFVLAEADMIAAETQTKCLLAEASLVSAETAAMSRISQ